MGLDTIVERKAVFEATIAPSLQTTWQQECTEAPVNENFDAMNLLELRDARE